MPRRASSQPTEAELEILNVLWQQGPSTVRQVHETLQADRHTSLTTTLKMLQVMTIKDLVVREDTSRPHKYRPSLPEGKVQLQLLDDLVQRAFGGSASRMLVRAISGKRLTKEELQEIRKLIDAIRKEAGGQKR